METTLFNDDEIRMMQLLDAHERDKYRVINLLPKVKEAGLMNSDASVRALIYMLEANNNPYQVIDELIMMLSKLKKYNEMLLLTSPGHIVLSIDKPL